MGAWILNFEPQLKPYMATPISESECQEVFVQTLVQRKHFARDLIFVARRHGPVSHFPAVAET